MLSKSILATAVLATAASANFMAHAEMKRELLQPRATATDSSDGISTECQTALLDIYSSLPSPPPEIVSDAVEHPQTDPCSFSTPASLSKEYASYSSEVVAWYSSNQGEIQSVLSECPILSQYATMVPVCETGAAGGAVATATDGSAVATETGADASGAASAASSAASSGAAKASSAASAAASKATSAASAAASAASSAASAAATKTANAGARETGMAMAAMAVAGIVVAAL